MSLFSARHYVWLAKTCHDMVDAARPRGEAGPVSDSICILADKLEAESEGFDRQLFLANVFGQTDPS